MVLRLTDEFSEHGRMSAVLIRQFAHHGGDIVRVRVSRHNSPVLSSACAQVRTPGGRWTDVAAAPTSMWHRHDGAGDAASLDMVASLLEERIARILDIPPHAQMQMADEVVGYDIGRAAVCTRFYHDRGMLVRVRAIRAQHAGQSAADTAVLTPSREWSIVDSLPADRWYSRRVSPEDAVILLAGSARIALRRSGRAGLQHGCAGQVLRPWRRAGAVASSVSSAGLCRTACWPALCARHAAAAMCERSLASAFVLLQHAGAGSVSPGGPAGQGVTRLAGCLRLSAAS